MDGKGRTRRRMIACIPAGDILRIGCARRRSADRRAARAAYLAYHLPTASRNAAPPCDDVPCPCAVTTGGAAAFQARSNCLEHAFRRPAPKKRSVATGFSRSMAVGYQSNGRSNCQRQYNALPNKLPRSILIKGASQQRRDAPPKKTLASASKAFWRRKNESAI
jgi:hypothetical protein